VASTEGERGHREPSSPSEKVVARIFAEVLNITSPSASESFFSLGGNSLTAAKVIARVSKECGVRLPLNVLFSSPSVSALAAQVDQKALTP